MSNVNQLRAIRLQAATSGAVVGILGVLGAISGLMAFAGMAVGEWDVTVPLLLLAASFVVLARIIMQTITS